MMKLPACRTPCCRHHKSVSTANGAATVALPTQPHSTRLPTASQVVLGAGFLAATAYAAKSLVWPYMEGAYYSVSRGSVLECAAMLGKGQQCSCCRWWVGHG